MKEERGQERAKGIEGKGAKRPEARRMNRRSIEGQSMNRVARFTKISIVTARSNSIGDVPGEIQR